MPAHTTPLTRALQELGEGDPSSWDRLLSIAYDDLRAIAQSHVRRERAANELRATAVAHEAFLRLAESTKLNWKSRAHFFGAISTVVRRVLVDAARERAALRRGGDRKRVSLTIVEDCLAGDAGEAEQIDLLALDDALSALSAKSSRQAQVVQCRFFAGMTFLQTAEALSIPKATVESDWFFARAWILKEMRGHSADDN